MIFGMGFAVGKKFKIVLFKYIIIFLCLSLPSQSAFSQVNLDSIKQIIPSLSGTEKLRALEMLSYRYSKIDADQYLKYTLEGFEYAQAQQDSTFISKFLRELGYYYKVNGDYTRSLEYFNNSARIAAKYEDKKSMINAYTGLGTIYYELNIYDKALEYHTKSLTIKEEIGNKFLHVSYTNIGLIYYKIDDPQKALEYYEKSLSLKLELGDTARCILDYVNIGLAYYELANETDGVKAIESFRQAVDLSIRYNNYWRLGAAYNGIAQVYAKNLQYDSAKQYLKHSLNEKTRNKSEKLESSNYYLLAKIAFQEGKYDQALNYLHSSQKLNARLKDKNRIKNNYGLFAKIFEAKNRLDSAFHYQKQYSVIKDSIFSQELTNKLANVQIAKIEERSQKELADSDEKLINKDEELSNTKFFMFFLLSFLGLSLALIVVIYRNYVNTQKINRRLNESNNEIEEQKKNLVQKNDQLAEAQVTIQNQNEVLKNINVNLDNKVKARTLELKQSNTELDKSNRELEKAVKDLDQFIYKTSHDLRGPIATMQGVINLGMMEAKEERSKEYFNTLHEVSKNFNNVLFRLIEVHETYLTKPILEFLDPRDEISETTDRISNLSMEKNIKIITELEADGQWKSDKVLFNVIIENMIRNALHYKDRCDSTIKIKTAYQEKHLKIIIEDNGFGIQPADESKVFNIFFKGSPTPGGTGLEIYTAKIAIEKLNGVISLKKPIKNTIFEILLPDLNK